MLVAMNEVYKKPVSGSHYQAITEHIKERVGPWPTLVESKNIYQPFAKAILAL